MSYAVGLGGPHNNWPPQMGRDQSMKDSEEASLERWEIFIDGLSFFLFFSFVSLVFLFVWLVGFGFGFDFFF